MIHMPFHERLKVLRLNLGLSLKEVARRSNVPVSTYREWESGRKIIGEPYVKIAQALEVDLYTLLTGQTYSSLDSLQILKKIEILIDELKNSLQSTFQK